MLLFNLNIPSTTHLINFKRHIGHFSCLYYEPKNYYCQNRYPAPELRLEYCQHTGIVLPQIMSEEDMSDYEWTAEVHGVVSKDESAMGRSKKSVLVTPDDTKLLHGREGGSTILMSTHQRRLVTRKT